MIIPGQTIGIFGGGQLGRMTAIAARGLGYHIVALDPDASCAARFVVNRVIHASFDDVAAAKKLAVECQVATVEIEKVSTASLDAAAESVPVYPAAKVFHVVQDRLRQKRWLQEHGFPVVPFVEIARPEDFSAAASALAGEPGFLKVAYGGFDGRGQERVRDAADLPRAFAALFQARCILERAVNLEDELSVLVARRPGGESAVYPVSLNQHQAGILHWSVIPGPVPPAVASQAQEMALAIAKALGVVGLLVVEFFRSQDGQLLVNELAPRPHNTFHTTEVACLTSQFEQLVRAICDLPLGSVEVARPAALVNLLGDLWQNAEPPFARALAISGVRLHLYGKRQARPGRKMGHLSASAETPEAAVASVLHAFSALTS